MQSDASRATPIITTPSQDRATLPQDNSRLHAWKSLLFLLRLQTMANIRRTIRRMWSPKRALLTFLAAGLLVAWFSQEMAIVYTVSQAGTINVERMRLLAPLVMLGIFALKISPMALRREHLGIDIRGAERFLLLAGPFRWREVRAFKLGRHVVSIAVTALFASLFIWNDVAFWLAGYAGAFFAMLSIYLLYMACAVTVTHATHAAYNTVRAIAIVSATGLVMYCVNGAVGHAATDDTPLRLITLLQQAAVRMAELGQTPVGYVLLLPFHVCTTILTAPRWWPFCVSVSLASTMVALQFVSVLSWEQWMIMSAQTRHQNLFRSGFADRITTRHRGTMPTAHWTVPRLPFLMGSGPIAWRHACSARSHWSGLLVLAVMIAAATWIAMTNPGQAPQQADFSAWLMMIFFSSLLLPGVLPYDFRTDYERIALFKTLPLSAWSITIGQLMIPVVLTTLLQCIALVTWWLINPEHGWSLFVGPVYLLLVNTLVFAVENVVFLLYPYSPNELGFHATAGRVLKAVARILLFALIACSAIGFAYATLYLVGWCGTDGAIPEFMQPILRVWWIGGSWLLLFMATLGTLKLLVATYRRYDPNVDSPLRLG